MRARRLVAVTWLLAAVASAAAAQTPRSTHPAHRALIVSLGAIGVERGEDTAEAFEVEYRFAPRAYGLQPAVGAFVTADDTFYVRAGLGRDFALAERWIAHASFAVGAYERGDGKDLGGTLEFRSALDIGYEVTDGFRVGVALAHLSNGGISETNPGNETLTLTFGWNPRRR